MNSQKCHFRIYIRDEGNKFTIPLSKNGNVLVFNSLGEANSYAQKQAGLKCDYKVR